MNKKKNTRHIVIVILIIALVMVLIGFVYNLFDSKTLRKNFNQKEIINYNSTEITYEQAVARANESYSGENKKVEVTEDSSGFIIFVKNLDTNEVVLKLHLNKKSGLIEHLNGNKKQSGVNVSGG